LNILACYPSHGSPQASYKGEPQPPTSIVPYRDTQEPHLNFDVLTEIRKRVNVPLVMHGGSGVSDSDYVKAINSGIRKVNYYTYGAKYAGEAVRATIDKAVATNPDAIVYWHDMTCAAYESFVSTFEHIVRVFANGAEPIA